MMETRIKASSRIISLCLVLAMLLALVPAFPIAANAVTTYNVKVYFKDTAGWGSVAGYVWNGTGSNLLGDWPGKVLSYDSNTNCYLLECSYTVGTNTAFNFIFNNNNQGAQTADLKLTNSQLASCQTWWVNGPSAQPTQVSLPVNNNGKVTFTYTNASASSVKLAGTMNNWSGVAMTKNGSTFTYTYELAPGAHQYKFVVDGNWISDPANPATTGNDGNSVYVLSGLQATTLNVVKGVATELPSVLPYTDGFGSASQKAVTYTVPSTYSSYATLSGNTLTVKSAYTGSTMTLNAKTTDGETAVVTLNLVNSASEIPTVKVHFVNTLGWQGVCYYAWSNTTGSTFNGGTWPGKIAQRDGTGVHTVELSHIPAAGETLGILFHDNKGAQTADVTITNAQLNAGSDLWVIPKTTAGEDGKYTCTVTTDASKAVYSPVVNGNQVTFKYSGSATSVAVAGSFNDWSTSANKMTKGSDGVWSLTMTLEPGVHEYKFVVNGSSWKLDPMNGIVGGYDQNNIVEVPGDEKVESGKIKVVLHFYRANGNYTGWDVWFWGNGTEGAVSFSDDPVNKGKIAAFYVDADSNSNLGYVVRKTDWSDKEFYDRFIDLSDVVGGTVHYYLNAGSETGSRVLGADAINGGKVTDAALDYSTGKLYPNMSMPITGSVADAFDIVDTTGKDTDVAITSVDLVDGKYVLTLNKKLGTNGLSNYKVTCNGTGGPVWVNAHALFYNGDFNRDYNYTGNDLGATWSKSSTTFKVWAPTAKHVQVLRYRGGNYGGNDWIETVDMTLGEKGVWTATVSGDLHGTY
jgi:pullulanase